MKVFIKTFGCRTNIYDSELIRSNLDDSFKIVNSEKDADIIIINSCSVTNSADSGARNYINKFGDKKIIFTGCGIKLQGEKLFNQNKIFGVLGMGEKNKISDLLKKDERFFIDSNKNFIDNQALDSFNTHTKAFIKIQEGCNFNCSYCIIPFTRGKSRSSNEEFLIDEIKRLIDKNFSEFVLTGTNIGSYGVDTNSSLAKLLKKIVNLDGVKRIRLGSIEPSQIDDEFFEIINNKKIERHLHIALQHTSKKMLKIMKRRNEALKDLELFLRLSELGFFLGTDFIVAHPGESEEIFEEALINFKKFPITHLHAFIYSPRSGTPSALMKNSINGKVAKERLKILKNITNLKNYEFRKKNKDEILKVLIESKTREFYEGYDQFFNKILVKSDKNIEKKWLEIKDYEIKFETNFCKF